MLRMSRSAAKRPSKKDCSQDVLESRGKEDNFSRLKSVFEIRRPYKSSSSTLKKSKSTSVLSEAPSSDDDELKSTKDRVFVRNSSARSSVRSTYKHKKVKEKGLYPKEHDKMKNNVDDILKKSISVEESSRRPKRQKEAENNISDNLEVTLDKNHLQKFNEMQKKLNEYETANQNKCSLEDEGSRSLEETIMENKFIKNDKKPNKINAHYYTHDSSVSNSSGSSKPLKGMNARKQTKEERKAIKSFVDAENEGETETYRKSLVLEMDLEVAKMKLDGFIDEEENVFGTTPDENVEVEKVHYSKVSRYKQLFEGMFRELDQNMEIFQNDCASNMGHGFDTEQHKCQHEDEQQMKDSPDQEEPSDCQGCLKNLAEESNIDCSEPDTKTLTENVDTDSIPIDTYDSTNSITIQKQERSVEDEFCESLGDDLENGSYFVEAYNDEGRELVIVEISLERRTVNFAKPFPLESLQSSFKNADMVFQEKNDKSLNMIDDPKEFVNENAELVSYGPHSNRSTLYSTTSRDSDVFDTDDEGIGMGNVEHRNREDGAYNNARRETFCDHQGIVRIERIGYPETVHGTPFEEGTEPESPVSRNNSFAQKGKLSYIIDEIKSTEKKYVEDLQKVVYKYVPYIERHTPAHLLGKNSYIFGNIHMLLHYQKQFLDALEKCGEEVEDIIKTFLDFEHLFELYPNYFKNKPKADVVIRDFGPIVKRAQERLKERLDLSAYLLTPLQRLGKYKLFLENIEKQLGKLELPTFNATLALEIIKREMSKGNDFVAIESIENSPVNKLDYGSFKMREKFNILKPRRFEAMVFLFENIIVFTLNNQNNMENYVYCDSIKMNDLRIATFEDLTIHLTDFTKCKKVSKTDKFTYILEAKTERIKDLWRKTIEDMLWQQLLKVKENTLKMYQAKATKRGKVFRNRTKSAGASTFYVTI